MKHPRQTFLTRALYALMILFVTTAAQHAQAQYKYESFKNDPLNTRIYTLANGLKVYISVNKNEPRVQTAIAVRAGSKHDPSDATGLAHYLEHMLFKGTDKYGTQNAEAELREVAVIENLFETYRQTRDEAARRALYRQIDSVSQVAASHAIANEYDKMLTGIGAKGTNAYTWVEQTVYVNDVPANNLERWLMIEAERFRKPVLRLFHTELEAVYEEKNRGLDDDNNQAFEALFEELFRNHTYGTQTTIGTVEHLKNPSMKKIREYYEKYYVPNNMAIILAGDIDPDRTIAAIDRLFGYMQPKPVAPYTFQPEQPRNAPARREIFGPDAESIGIGFRLPGATTRDAKVLMLVDMLLANGTAGFIDLNLNQKQTVLAAYGFFMAFADYSAHVLGGQPKEGQKLEEVEKLLLDQLQLVKQGKFDESQLRAVINDLTIRRTRELQENSGRVNRMVDAYVTGHNYQDYTTMIDFLSTVTKKEVVDVANKYYGNDYVVIYKRLGERPPVKVTKPEITPVTVNRDTESPFVKSISAITPEKVSPRFLNYDEDIKQIKLSNGLPVWYLKNTENQLFSLYYVLDMGQRHDKKMAFAVEYLKFLGTDKLSAEALQKKLYELGLSFSVSASDDQVYVFLTGLDKNFDEGVKLFESLLANPKPDQQALTSLVENTLKAREDAKKNKQVILFQALQQYGVHGRVNPMTDILSEGELKALTPGELVAKIKSLTGYEHRVMYYGPQEATNVSKKLSSMHKTPAKLAAIPNVPNYKFQDTKENTVYFVDYPMQQAEVILMSKSFNYDPTRVPVMQLYNEYFGGGMSSIVFQTIRESKALAYAVWSNFITPQKVNEPNYVFAYVGTQADKLPETMSGMFELLNDLPKSDPNFSQAKQAILSKIETERTLRENILFAYESAKKLGLNKDIRQDIYAKIPTMSFDDIQAFQKEFIKDKKYTILVLGDKSKVDQSVLAKYGTVKHLTLRDVFGY
ncbi:MAG TPA: insulinase family protein [Candidatus Kapabacteria bacterium]|nr:insulinase family protein [Candidatus Kapabacteria bacterium]